MDQSRGTSTKQSQITFDTKLKICCFHGEIRAVNNSCACSCVASKNQALVKKTLMSLVTCDHFTAQAEVKYCETLKLFRFVLLRFRLIYFSVKNKNKNKKTCIYIYTKKCTFEVINMSWARLIVILARAARGGLK